jgi:hypothetical protein
MTDKSADIFSRYLECLQMEVGLAFVPNVIESLSKILITAEAFPWVDSRWRESKALEVKACAAILSRQETGTEPILIDSKSENPVSNTDKYHRAAFFCQTAGDLNLQTAAFKLLLLSALIDPQKPTFRVPKNLTVELRTSFCLRRKLDTLLSDFPSPDSDEYLSELTVSLSKARSDEGVESFRRILSKFIHGEQFSNLRASKAAPRQGSGRAVTRSSPSSKKSRRKKPRKPRGQFVYFKPAPKTTVSQYPAAGSLVEEVEIEEGGLPTYRLHYDEDDADIDLGEEELDTQDEISDLMLLGQSIRSSHWMRHQRSISQVSLRILTKVERKRFLTEHLGNLSADKASERAWSLANLVSYQTSISAHDFLFDEHSFSEIFDSDGRYIQPIVRVDTGYRPEGTTEDKFRGYLDQTHMSLRGGIGEIIADLILDSDCKTFAEALGVSREEISKAGKKMTSKLRDGNRYLITQSKVENALFNGLSDLKNNSSLAFLLAGKSSQMYTTLLFYWGVPERKLLDSYESVMEDFLWV